MRLSAIERKILNCLQEDIPFTSRPFKILSSNLGIREEELIKKIKLLKTKGFIRNFSCRLNHKKFKYKSTLLALRLPLNRVNSIAKRISESPLVTHCYLRQGEFNLWSVFVYKNGKLNKFLNKITKEVGKENILNFATLRQFKLKTHLKV